MRDLTRNELIGAVALQSALEHATERKLSLAKAMLVLPLLFDNTIRSVLKNKRSVVLSSKDLLISKPSAFLALRTRFEDMTITSINTILLGQELGMATLEGDRLQLKKKVFTFEDSDIGKLATEMLASGPKLGLILSEPVADLYQTFRIDL